MNFKKLALSLIAISSIASAAAAKTRGDVRPESRAPGAIKKLGPEVPFPLSASLPFPWKKIEGLWEAVAPNGRSVLFSFERRYDYDGNDILQVTQLDGATKVILAEGLGLQSGEDNLVRAAMYGYTSQANYMIFIGAFKNPKPTARGAKTITVVTVRAFGEMTGEADLQLVVKKVSSKPYKTSVARSGRWK